MVNFVFSLESPHRGDSNEYKQYAIFNIKKKITLNYPKSLAMRFFERTQERVRNTHDKRAINVRATEGQLCYYFYYQHHLLLLLEMIIKIVVIGSEVGGGGIS